MQPIKTLAVFACLAGSGIANAQTTILAKVSTDHKITPIEAAAAIVIGSALGMKVDALVLTSRNTNTSIGLLGPALVISQSTHRRLSDVLHDKPKGEGWGNVAKRMGMHPGDFNKMRVKGGSFESMCWQNMLYTKYRFPAKEYLRVQQQGLTDNEIVLAVVQSQGKRAPLDRAVLTIKNQKAKAKGKGKGNSGGHGGGHGGH